MRSRLPTPHRAFGPTLSSAAKVVGRRQSSAQVSTSLCAQERTDARQSVDFKPRRSPQRAVSSADSGYGSEPGIHANKDTIKATIVQKEGEKNLTIDVDCDNIHNISIVGCDNNRNTMVNNDGTKHEYYMSGALSMSSDAGTATSLSSNINQASPSSNDTRRSNMAVLSPTCKLEVTCPNHHNRRYENETVKIGPPSAANHDKLMMVMHKSCNSILPVKCVLILQTQLDKCVDAQVQDLNTDSFEDWTASCAYCHRDMVIPGWIGYNKSKR